MIKSLPLVALSLLLGFFFVFVGSIKLTPKINPDVYRDMQQEFGRFNKVFPLYKWTNWRPYAKNYRLTVGFIECICGAILILIPGRLKDLSSLMLLCIMMGAGYTHYMLGDPFERMAPALVFGLLLICRFIILYQVTQRENKAYEKLRARILQTLNEEEIKKKKRVGSGDNDDVNAADMAETESDLDEKLAKLMEEYEEIKKEN